MYKELPTKDGLQLWLVHLEGHYCDDGPVPVNGRVFVLAKTRAQALAAVEPHLESYRKQCEGAVTIKAAPFPLEELLVARSSEGDGRLGWHSNTKLQPVNLMTDGYRLAVCLIRD